MDESLTVACAALQQSACSFSQRPVNSHGFCWRCVCAHVTRQSIRPVKMRRRSSQEACVRRRRNSQEKGGIKANARLPRTCKERAARTWNSFELHLNLNGTFFQNGGPNGVPNCPTHPPHRRCAGQERTGMAKLLYQPTHPRHALAWLG
jgi:hypothetical protein